MVIFFYNTLLQSNPNSGWFASLTISIEVYLLRALVLIKWSPFYLFRRSMATLSPNDLKSLIPPTSNEIKQIYLAKFVEKYGHPFLYRRAARIWSSFLYSLPASMKINSKQTFLIEINLQKIWSLISIPLRSRANHVSVLDYASISI